MLQQSGPRAAGVVQSLNLATRFATLQEDSLTADNVISTLRRVRGWSQRGSEINTFFKPVAGPRWRMDRVGSGVFESSTSLLQSEVSKASASSSGATFKPETFSSIDDDFDTRSATSCTPGAVSGTTTSSSCSTRSISSSSSAFRSTALPSPRGTRTSGTRANADANSVFFEGSTDNAFFTSTGGSSSSTSSSTTAAFNHGSSTVPLPYFLAPSLPLLHSLTARFFETCEHFYPPQILEILSLCADIGHSDENLMRAVVGRLDDLLASTTATPTSPNARRVAQIVIFCARARVPSHHWWPLVRDPLEQNLHNLAHGIPNLLDALLFVFPRKDLQDLRKEASEERELFIDSLATQMLLHKEELGPGVFAKGFEALSRHAYRYTAVEDEAAALLDSTTDVVAQTTLVAGMQRYLADEKKRKGAQEKSGKSFSEIKLDLEWSGRKGVVCSEKQVAEFVNEIEAAAQESKYVWRKLPHKLNQLARISCESAAANTLRCNFIYLSIEKICASYFGRYSASQLLDLAEATELIALQSGPPSSAQQISVSKDKQGEIRGNLATLMPQLDLNERRRLWQLCVLGAGPDAGIHNQQETTRTTSWHKLSLLVERGGRPAAFPTFFRSVADADVDDASDGSPSSPATPNRSLEPLSVAGDILYVTDEEKKEGEKWLTPYDLDASNAPTLMCKLHLTACKKAGWNILGVC
ncbi:unnamed protein product [Amoebophrya sp. A25]|nr:unnamed protein product [Amoebophrya sp. A25]|eukprot:GSA25T00006915001.1